MKHTNSITGKSLFSKVVSIFAAVALVAGILPVTAVAISEEELKLGVISDVHYYSEDYSDFSDAFGDWAMGGNKQYINQRGILNSALAFYKAQAQEGKVDYLIIPGDLTRNGEYFSHKQFAEIMENFEEESGIQVMVINGNHDINNSKAVSYVDGDSPVEITSPEDFKEIYKNLGYDVATSVFTPPEGEKAGMLSYSVVIDGFRLLFIDGGRYSADNTESGEDEHETAGNYSEALREWLLEQCLEARQNGETIIGVDHWSLVPHYESQDRILQGFTLDNWLEVGEELTDAGMHFAFTGHSHSNDVSQNITDSGNVLWDIQTCSLVEFPHYIRTAQFTNKANGEVVFDYEYHEVDEVQPVTVRDTEETYAQPYRTSFSFGYTYKGDVANYAKALAGPLLTGFFEDIQAVGGLYNYLNDAIGLEDLLFGYIGPFTSDIMEFVKDLGKQIDERYINDPEYTLTVVNSIIDRLCNFQISEYPFMGLYEEYGVGGPDTKGTFGNAVFTLLINMGHGNEDMSDPFMVDVVDQFENGDLGERIFNLLYDLVVNQLAKDEILSNLYVNADTFFNNTDYPVAGDGVQGFLNILVGVLNSDSAVNSDGKISYLELADGVLNVLDKLDVLEGGSVDGTLAHLMEEYITESQYEAWGHTFAYIISDFCSDSDPWFQADLDGQIVYDGKKDVPVNTENYRQPSLISVTLGNDSQTQMNISWYGKYSLNDGDIEIIEKDSGEEFLGYGRAPAGVRTLIITTETTRTFPGIDLGIIGIFPYEVKLQRTTVQISGLKPGTEYLFRVANKKQEVFATNPVYGSGFGLVDDYKKICWWSDVGQFKTADGSDETTFLHITDSQGQNEKQYAEFAKVYDKAIEMYSDTDLTIHSGDLTDYGSNLLYWGYLFNSTSNMQNVPLMPVAGNHETMGDTAALLDNFVLPNVPEQDNTSGTYYSFDYNNVHFMMLNTNDTEEDELGEEQIRWLKKDAKSSTAKWKVVVIHKAVYSNGSHYDDSDVEGLRAQLSELMPQLDIDIVFQGHDHVYLRTDAMNNNEVVDVETVETQFNGKTYETKVSPDGTIYAISGASGVKNYIAKSNSETDELFPRAESIVKTDKPVFTGIRIVGDYLYYDSYTVENGEAELIDSFAIYKEYDKGDADCDGELSPKDIRLIMAFATKIETPTEQQIKLCDFNGDGYITLVDARILLKRQANII